MKQTNNPHTRKWLEFKGALHEDKLREKYRPKSYEERAKGLYIASLAGTYVGNIISAVSMSALVLYAVMLIVIWQWVGIVVALLAVFMIEWFKRSLASHIWHELLIERERPVGMIVVMLLLGVLSVAGSIIGANWAIRSIGEKSIVKVSYQDRIGEITKEIHAIDKQIAAQSANKTETGQIYYNSQRAIKALTEQKRDLIDERKALRKRERDENNTLKINSMADIDKRAYYAGWVVLLFEVIFHLSFFFKEEFLRRVAVEKGILKRKGGGSSAGGSMGGSMGGFEKKSPLT